eukprot:CAMPEP_0201704180 /NCGR_PEP_ID=MMETSP0578-20130828/42060_1 /ASSEMBLY_ACC=CAM_ASM_000663 /TAXON_ID=267565 /ORGANISM="Skeletonema grethea, Strain CCMP 1804" /LENGTH=255 /DNA_ID=CAMNT_0048192155 /DNA_START=25 /DNA_END=789 /DNA_ORIENTATION=+
MNDYILPNRNHEEPHQEEDEKEHSTRLFEWRGNWVSKEEAIALHHVFDNLQDYFGFGHQVPDPRVKFNLISASSNARDLKFTYDIDGHECNLAYIGIDICLDLSHKLVHRHGQQMMQDYGKSWLFAYMPGTTMDKIKSYVKNGTGLDVSNECAVHDLNRNLVGIEAKMHHQSGTPKPSFWVLPEEEQASSITRDNSVEFSRIGTVQEVFDEQKSKQRIHRGIGMFAVSLEVDDTSDSDLDGEASLSFTLVSIRTW